MKLNILLKTADYRGDHAADVAVALDPVPGETVEELVQRSGMLSLDSRKGPEVIEIRLAVGRPS